MPAVPTTCKVVLWGSVRRVLCNGRIDQAEGEDPKCARCGAKYPTHANLKPMKVTK